MLAWKIRSFADFESFSENDVGYNKSERYASKDVAEATIHFIFEYLQKI